MTIIWSKENCIFCDMAKDLLEHNNISYEERKIGHGYSKDDLLAVLPDAKTVPQIFIDDKYIGGFTELSAHLAEITTMST